HRLSDRPHGRYPAGRCRTHDGGPWRGVEGIRAGMKLHHRIFLGLLAGLALGAISRFPGAEPFQRVLIACEPLGTAFIRLITMVVVPLVVASLFVGVASLGDRRRLGRIGGKALAYFVVTTVVAATIG